ncbi:WD domain-containing protein [Madurella fahalii]|uniref:WD domain-containing protein n=1 Tax=Madurella fahalii TaxID=1157608 RepID=A0ABQ0G8L8_9PEZI
MSSPHQSPRHSRHPSLDFHSAASYSPQLERRQSKASSFNEPPTPLRSSFNASEGMDIGGDGGGGLGNLADELAGAFDDDYEGEYGDEDHEGEGEVEEDAGGAPDISLDGAEDGTANGEDRGLGKDGGGSGGGVRDSGVDVESGSPVRSPNKRGSLGVPVQNNGRGHRRAGSEYDGSEYGSESDLESPGMPPKLVDKMDEVESLARRGAEKNGSAADGTFARVTEGLRDLGSQSGIEGGATRLITAHSALTTHLTHQTRQLHNLTFPLLSPLVAPPDPETIDSLLPMLISLSDYMPRPSTSAFQSLASLHSITADLVQTLNYLSDTLHMSRQTTTTATRRLKSARDLVAEMRRDEELREQGERWLTRGNWGERLQKRECAHVCGEVVGGFEEVCNNWRKRLLALAESSQA